MANLSRRKVLLSAAALAAAPRLSSPATSPLRVQYTIGSHTVPLQQYAMFDDEMFQDLDTCIRPHPHPFNEISGAPGRPGPDVLVLGDYMTGNWPEADHAPMEKFLNAGKGLVVLHHSVGDNQNWPWWYESVLCGALVQQAAMQARINHHSSLKKWPHHEGIRSL